MPKLRHFDHLDTARFITFSCYRRHRLLANEPVILAFLETLQTILVQRDIRIFGYVIMPEHVHLVIYPRNTLKLGPVIGELKSKSASRVIAERLAPLPANCRVFKDAEKPTRRVGHPGVLKGKLVVCGESEECELGEGDTIYIPGNENHVVKNPLDCVSTGLDIFVPGRSFDFWLNKSK